jgi:hypothetical protein
MNRLTVASIGISVAALIVGFALGNQFQFTSIPQTKTTTLTSLSTSTEFVTSSVFITSKIVSTVTANQTSTTSNTVSTVCSVSAKTGVLVHLVNDQGGTVAGVPVSSYAVFYCNNERQVVVNPVNVTNSSGWADLRYGPIGNYYVSVGIGYPTIYYNFTVPTQPEATSVVTYHLYSGNLTIQFCGYFGGPLTKCGVV